LLAINIRIYHDAQSSECHIHKMHSQSNTNTAPLVVHHSLWCHIDGGNKSKLFVRRNFFSQTFMATMGGFDSILETTAFATNREVSN